MKNILALLICTVLILTCSTTASAHPGRTDSNGGHWDNSVGEYHYHHGHSAHDHYDVDGDGDIDCPHDFRDNKKTNNVISVDSESIDVFESSTHESTGSHKRVEFFKVIHILPMILFATLVFIPAVSTILFIIPNPITWVIELLSRHAKDQDKAYRRLFALFLIIVDIFVIYQIIMFL